MTTRSKNSSENWKIHLIILGQGCIALLFSFRLFQIQVLDHDKYSAMAQEQYWSLQEIPAQRGDILSSDGYALATTQVSYLMYGEPGNISDSLQVANDLSKVLIEYKQDFYEDGVQKEALFESEKERFNELLNLELQWVALEHYLTDDAHAAILSLGIEGIGFEEEPKRYYPENILASHVLGFVAKNESGEAQGYFGIEGTFDGDLRGKPGKIVEERDAMGAPILVGGFTRVDPIKGREIGLTLNRAVQYIIERKLEAGVRKYGAASGSVIIMDPFTGDIVAMANFPSYHPERFNDALYEISKEVDKGADVEAVSEIVYATQRINASISETYEPGSVIKPLTIAAGIDLKKITPESTFEDEGPSHYSGYEIDNWDGKHHGTQTIVNLLQKSNNIGSAWVGHLVGSRHLSNYFEKFGLGDITGVDLEGEDTGIIRNHKDWTDIDLATAAFGQGISATPLQVLNAFNALANGGNLLRPRIVSHIVEGSGVIEMPVKTIRQVISKKSSETMIYMLTEAVSGGESKYFNIKNYDIAGKTGTAQIPIDGKYDPEQTNATFVGFPSVSKRFSMIVRLEKPQTSTYASETAVPLWMDIADDLLKFYGIAPDR